MGRDTKILISRVKLRESEWVICARYFQMELMAERSWNFDRIATPGPDAKTERLEANNQIGVPSGPLLRLHCRVSSKQLPKPKVGVAISKKVSKCISMKLEALASTIRLISPPLSLPAPSLRKLDTLGSGLEHLPNRGGLLLLLPLPTWTANMTGAGITSLSEYPG